MPQSFARINYHIVFSTKGRRPLLPRSVRSGLFDTMGSILKCRGCRLLEAGGIEDHVHLLIDVARDRSMSDIVRDIKANSSKILRADGHPSFAWQRGYAAFTVSYLGVDVVRRYIRNQEEHHRKAIFEEEYVRLLEEHEIPYDQRYMWD